MLNQPFLSRAEQFEVAVNCAWSSPSSAEQQSQFKVWCMSNSVVAYQISCASIIFGAYTNNGYFSPLHLMSLGTRLLPFYAPLAMLHDTNMQLSTLSLPWLSPSSDGWGWGREGLEPPHCLAGEAWARQRIPPIKMDCWTSTGPKSAKYIQLFTWYGSIGPE